MRPIRRGATRRIDISTDIPEFHSFLPLDLFVVLGSCCIMEELEKRILADGRVLNDHVLKVDSFLNHQIDVALLDRIGKSFYGHFGDYGITKILTVEASGIAVACSTARHFHVPVVFARKTPSVTSVDDHYFADVYSFTKQRTFTIMISKRFLAPKDTVLLVDDFLASGQALLGLAKIVSQAGASLAGAGIVIEKAFQRGKEAVKDVGLEVYSMARIASLKNNTVVFQ